MFITITTVSLIPLLYLQNTLKFIRKGLPYIRDFLHLIYPEKCVSCANELTDAEAHVCSLCDAELIETSYHLHNEPTAFDKLFWGRVHVDSTFALYSFKKNSTLQRLLFQFKYHHTQAIGNEFGARIGKRINGVAKYTSIDVLLPVPLHPKKQFVRGYNQSLALANGVSKSLNVPVSTKVLCRRTNNTTQTKKDRFDRWSNVSSIFTVSEALNEYNHIAIIDDVVTTGSTLEAVIRAIREVRPDIRISVLTMAIA